VFLFAHHQHRAPGVTNNLFGGASKAEVRKASQRVCRNHEQVHRFSLCQASDFTQRLPRLNQRADHDAAGHLLASERTQGSFSRVSFPVRSLPLIDDMHQHDGGAVVLREGHSVMDGLFRTAGEIDRYQNAFQTQGCSARAVATVG
jgi:hypothetical protein